MNQQTEIIKIKKNNEMLFIHYYFNMNFYWSSFLSYYCVFIS